MSTKAVKGSVLCLHGYAQNGPVFSAKASAIRKALKKIGYHTVFMNGPLKIKPSDMPFEVKAVDGKEDEEPDFRGWFPPTDSYDIQPAFDAVKKCYEEHGPFVGIIGFSQGAGLTAALINQYADIVGSAKAKDELKFGIIYSGFVLKPPQYKKFYEPIVKLPTLHIFGELDTLVSSERSEALVALCENATVLKHPGGHYVPSTKDLIKKEIAWIENVLSDEPAKSEVKEDAKADKDDLDKLADQIDKLGTV